VSVDVVWVETPDGVEYGDTLEKEGSGESWGIGEAEVGAVPVEDPGGSGRAGSGEGGRFGRWKLGRLTRVGSRFSSPVRWRKGDTPD